MFKLLIKPHHLICCPPKKTTTSLHPKSHHITRVFCTTFSKPLVSTSNFLTESWRMVVLIAETCVWSIVTGIQILEGQHLVLALGYWLNFRCRELKRGNFYKYVFLQTNMIYKSSTFSNSVFFSRWFRNIWSISPIFRCWSEVFTYTNRRRFFRPNWRLQATQVTIGSNIWRIYIYIPTEYLRLLFWKKEKFIFESFPFFAFRPKRCWSFGA